MVVTFFHMIYNSYVYYLAVHGKTPFQDQMQDITIEIWQLLINGKTSVERDQQFDGISVKLRHQKTCREAYNGL